MVSGEGNSTPKAASSKTSASQVQICVFFFISISFSQVNIFVDLCRSSSPSLSSSNNNLLLLVMLQCIQTGLDFRFLSETFFSNLVISIQQEFVSWDCQSSFFYLHGFNSSQNLSLFRLILQCLLMDSFILLLHRVLNLILICGELR